MSYEEFRKKVIAIANKANTKVRFEDQTSENGIYIAFAGDITMSANQSSNDITVRWGSQPDRRDPVAPAQYRKKHTAILKG